MKNKSNIVFLLLLLFITLSIVRAQSTTTGSLTPTASATPAVPTGHSQVDECIALKQCADDDVACRAKCAGVPNPTEDQVNETKTCIDACVPTDPTYAACKESCINKYYNPLQVSTSPTPSASASASASAASKNSKASNGSVSNVTVMSPFGSFFALFSALIVIIMSVCCF